jgi:hypothetical protein
MLSHPKEKKIGIPYPKTQNDVTPMMQVFDEKEEKDHPHNVRAAPGLDA